MYKTLALPRRQTATHDTLAYSLATLDLSDRLGNGPQFIVTRNYNVINTLRNSVVNKGIKELLRS